MSMLDGIRPDWPAPDNVRAYCSTRIGGVSEGPWSSLNLADHVGDDPENVRLNRQRLYSQLELPADPVWLQQVHGCDVVTADEANGLACCDASVTSEAGVVCAVLTADCLPVLLCHESGSHIAAAHAGWRGLATGIIEQTVKKMNCQPAEILAWLGPAIGPEAFEVGPEVRQQFVELDQQAAIAFQQTTETHWLCDMYRLARMRLKNIGVGHVSGGEYCTYSDAERFYREIYMHFSLS